jgi:hypothetical protein
MDNEETNNYKKREIDMFHSKIEDGLSGIHVKIDTLNQKVGIQNGRVGKLEKWQSFTMGGLAVISAIVLPVIFILVRSLL